MRKPTVLICVFLVVEVMMYSLASIFPPGLTSIIFLGLLGLIVGWYSWDLAVWIHKRLS